jgi:hypothetical protein
MYIIKIQGTNKIPDYVQIRDDRFMLIAYFKVSSPRRALEKCGLAAKAETVMEIVNELPYGQIRKLDL